MEIIISLIIGMLIGGGLSLVFQSGEGSRMESIARGDYLGYTREMEPTESDITPTTDQEIKTEGYQLPWVDCIVHYNTQTTEFHYDGDSVVGERIRQLENKAYPDQCQDTGKNVVLADVTDLLEFMIIQKMALPSPVDRLMNHIKRINPPEHQRLDNLFHDKHPARQVENAIEGKLSQEKEL